MKINYTFLKELQNILLSQGDAWQANIAQDIQTKEARIQDLQVKKMPTAGLEQYIEKLKKDLADGVYSWNVKPFNDISNAQFLLANVHLLEDPLLSRHFNPKAVTALKAMLSEKFGKIYCENVYEHKSKLSGGNMVFIKSTTVNEILNEELPTFENFVVPELADAAHQLTDAARLKVAKTLFSNIKLVDIEFLTEVTQAFLWISRCYISTNDALLNVVIPTTLGLCFNNIEDVDRFLANHVDYTSPTTLENSFVAIHEMEMMEALRNISPYEKAVWSKLNAAYGKESMALFFRQKEIAKQFNNQLWILFRNYDDNLEEIFTHIQLLAKNALYKNASQNPELAEIAFKYDIPEEIFNKILEEIIPRKKSSDNLPDINFSVHHHGQVLQFTKLPAGDLRGLFLGKMTGCCQYIGGDSGPSVVDGFTREDAGFYVLRDAEGTIRAQSYAWIGTNEAGNQVLVLDSFEHKKDVETTYIPVMKSLHKALTRDYSEFVELHVGTGGNTPRTITTNTNNNIKSPEGLTRYPDSKYTYHITQDVALYPKEGSEFLQYKNFKEYIEDNAATVFAKVSMEYSECISTLLSFMDISRDAKAIYLIAGNETLRSFIVEHIQSDPMTGEPTTKFFNEAHLRFSSVNNIKITAFHKLSIIKALIDSGCDIESMIRLYNEYLSLDPRILEHVGYEHMDELKVIIGIASSNEEVQAGLLEIAKSTDVIDKVVALKEYKMIADLDQEVIDRFGRDTLLGYLQNNEMSDLLRKYNVGFTPLQKITLISKLLDGSFGAHALQIITTVSHNKSDVNFELIILISKYVVENMSEEHVQKIYNLHLLVPMLIDSVEPMQLFKLWTGDYFAVPNFQDGVMPERQKLLLKEILDRPQEEVIKMAYAISSITADIANNIDPGQLLQCWTDDWFNISHTSVVDVQCSGDSPELTH